MKKKDVKVGKKYITKSGEMVEVVSTYEDMSGNQYIRENCVEVKILSKLLPNGKHWIGGFDVASIKKEVL
jgi:hypothetical protein